ncbi:MAG: DUF1015 domain-containing protein [Bryobacteraceae bacterium]|jgi:uncharacterized protein (DUF1015 family)
MAKIFPFQPYRYSDSAGPLETLVTQPYDKITPEMRARYLSLSPYNLVRVILGERFAEDSAEVNVYTRAAAYLEDWVARGILVKEAEPALFAYFQEFAVPDTGERLMRKGFIGLGAVEDYAEGVVHRHEQTLAGPKRDRLELLRHTRAHAGQLFMLYPDPAGEIDRILDEAANAAPAATVTDEYRTIHRLWKIAAPERIAAIARAMAAKKLLIADGHHRYETALAFRDENPGLEDARRVMMTFVNMCSPGLKILATHRLVAGLADFNTEALIRAAGLRAVGDLAALRELWAEPHAGRVRIGAALAGSEPLYVYEAERAEGELDVPVLHQRLLSGALGIDEEAVREEKNTRYMRGVEPAIAEVRRGAAQAAFLLEPTPIDDVARIAFAGGVMPQKSTDFYPKLLSGLTIYKLEK